VCCQDDADGCTVVSEAKGAIGQSALAGRPGWRLLCLALRHKRLCTLNHADARRASRCLFGSCAGEHREEQP
jgi:hypothetical protein